VVLRQVNSCTQAHLDMIKHAFTWAQTKWVTCSLAAEKQYMSMVYHWQKMALHGKRINE
jgi:hypothetical protein